MRRSVFNLTFLEKQNGRRKNGFPFFLKAISSFRSTQILLRKQKYQKVDGERERREKS